MSFLDNLENTLKNLESREEKDPVRERRLAEEREAKRLANLAAAPHLEALRKGKWTQDLLGHCVALGHRQRVRVGMVWVENVLRLEAKEKRLELHATPAGIEAVASVNGEESFRQMVQEAESPEALALRWLGV
jgi:hypothetical protein